MAIRKIVRDTDEILRKNSKPVVDFNLRLGQLIDDMVETMHEADGVGLAAVQVGVLRRVVVIDEGGTVYELINPTIIEQSGEQLGAEGCLSSPNQYGDVKRPSYVKVQAFDRLGNEIFVEGQDLLARAFCHEVDHLNGVLFKDLTDEIFEVTDEEKVRAKAKRKYAKGRNR